MKLRAQRGRMLLLAGPLAVSPREIHDGRSTRASMFTRRGMTMPGWAFLTLAPAEVSAEVKGGSADDAPNA